MFSAWVLWFVDFLVVSVDLMLIDVCSGGFYRSSRDKIYLKYFSHSMPPFQSTFRSTCLITLIYFADCNIK